jgi:uncharacterized membrane protein YhaH (DUF805 family)
MTGFIKRQTIWMVVLFALAIAAHAWYYVSTVLALPDISEEYARSWQYQLLMFAIVRLPLWLAAFVFTLVIRQFVTSKRSKL